MELQYVTNARGKKTAVQLSLKQWHELQKELKKLEMFEELKQAFKEMDIHSKGKLKTISTKQLLAQIK
jgi:hypothetical protein